jgi:hypothetical protein
MTLYIEITEDGFLSIPKRSLEKMRLNEPVRTIEPNNRTLHADALLHVYYTRGEDRKYMHMPVSLLTG